MCWRAIEKMHGFIEGGSLEALLRDNYAIAWILKAEDGRLPRSIRGATLPDAFATYAQCEVRLLPYDEVVIRLHEPSVGDRPA